VQIKNKFAILLTFKAQCLFRELSAKRENREIVNLINMQMPGGLWLTA